MAITTSVGRRSYPRGDHVRASLFVERILRFPLQSRVGGDGVRVVALGSVLFSSTSLPPERTFRFLLLFGILVLSRLCLRPFPDLACSISLTSAAWIGLTPIPEVNYAGNIVAHLIVPGLVAFLGVSGRMAIKTVTPKHASPLVKVFIVAVAVLLALAYSCCWEIYEWWARAYFTQRTIYASTNDTVTDVVSGVLGALLWLPTVVCANPATARSGAPRGVPPTTRSRARPRGATAR